MADKPLRDSDRVKLNRHLKDLEDIEEAVKLAKAAEVPGINEMERRCINCRRRIESIKRSYFPGKP